PHGIARKIHRDFPQANIPWGVTDGELQITKAVPLECLELLRTVLHYVPVNMKTVLCWLNPTIGEAFADSYVDDTSCGSIQFNARIASHLPAKVKDQNSTAIARACPRIDCGLNGSCTCST